MSEKLEQLITKAEELVTSVARQKEAIEATAKEGAEARAALSILKAKSDEYEKTILEIKAENEKIKKHAEELEVK